MVSRHERKSKKDKFLRENLGSGGRAMYLKRVGTYRVWKIHDEERLKQRKGTLNQQPIRFNSVRKCSQN